MLTSHGFSRAAVVGAGLMGRRIAGVLASAGLDVAITDTNAEILHAAAVEAARVPRGGRCWPWLGGRGSRPSRGDTRRRPGD
ncbi:putative 3-hydroxybutyryl-CoA dehydrogenase [Mycobacterium tuberculosis FJ05194]|nr:putative 3-hydroxybutyryl-CoA dehydrogenase [Mycobacterium tuberculosis FJ05194]